MASWLSADVLVGPVVVLAFLATLAAAALRGRPGPPAESRGRTLLQRSSFLRSWWDAFLAPVVALARRLGLGPDGLTVACFVLAVASAVLFALHHPSWAGLVLLLSGVLDSLDGRLARSTGAATLHGAFLDSALDRLGEIAIFCGLAVHFLGGPMAPVVTLALGASMLVAYTRARGHSLGLDYTGGFAGRAERLVLLAAGALMDPPAALLAGALGGPADPWLLPATLVLLALLASWTSLHRMVAIHRGLRAREASRDRPRDPAE